MSDLVQRLRAKHGPRSVAWEAADRIEALAHEINGLRGEIHSLMEDHLFICNPANSHWQGDVIKQQCDRINELEAALRTIAQMYPEVPTNTTDPLANACNIARRGLESSK